MRYATLYNKKLGECTYQELMRHFKKKVFYGFMEGGVHGMTRACRDAVENFIAHFEQKGTLKKDAVSDGDYEEYVEELAERIVDGFITQGSACIEERLSLTFTALAQHKKFK